jgi:hypothetical protein
VTSSGTVGNDNVSLIVWKNKQHQPSDELEANLVNQLENLFVPLGKLSFLKSSV